MSLYRNILRCFGNKYRTESLPDVAQALHRDEIENYPVCLFLTKTECRSSCRIGFDTVCINADATIAVKKEMVIENKLYIPTYVLA